LIFKSDGATGQGDLNGFLDRGSHLQGELRFEASFRVDGKVTGSVTSTGSLIVGDGGEVDGEVAVGRLFVSGVLRGAVKASGRIQVAPGGKVYADLVTPSLVIEDGAVFEGRCSMTGEPRASERTADGMAGDASKPKLVPKAAG
jgi:cytoskeletal protein CcmA (bactofilin family)